MPEQPPAPAPAPAPGNSNLGRPAPTPMPDSAASAAPESPRPINVPTEIGGYRIQRVLGSGGMATVYAAMQKQPRRVVALKVMKAGISMTHADANRRFKHEIEILGKLRHPYIAQIYGAGMHDDGGGAVPYFVMEYVPGAKTIVEFIEAKQLDRRDQLKLFAKVCAAVEHGHRMKVIHRDLKPANILIDESGEPKIIDFGVAQAAEIDVSTQTMHTEAGKIVGTLKYMSPEQLDSKQQDLDARCDVYSLGVLLYKMLTGQSPQELAGLSVYEAVRVIREQTPPPPSAIKPELKGDLETIILKAMEPDRTRRYRNAGSLGRDVVRYLANKPINARRASVMYRAGLFARRHRSALTAGGIVALVMAIALGIVLYDRSQRPVISPGGVAARTEGQAPPNLSKPADAMPAPTVAPFTLRRHSGTITDLAFSPDGAALASAAFDRRIVVWDLSTQRARVVVSDMEMPIRQLAFNHDGTILAAVADRGPIRIFDAGITADSSGAGGAGGAGEAAMPATNRRVPGTIHALALDSAGERLAFALDDFTVRVWPVEESDRRFGDGLLLRGTHGVFTHAQFSNDAATMAAAAQGGPVYLWNAADGKLLSQFDGLTTEPIALAFSLAHDGKSPRLVAVASDGKAMSWPLASDDALAAFEFAPRRDQAIVAASFDQSGRWLACASPNEVLAWDLAGDSPRQIAGSWRSEEVIHAIAVDATGQWCAIGHGSGDIEVKKRQ